MYQSLFNDRIVLSKDYNTKTKTKRFSHPRKTKTISSGKFHSVFSPLFEFHEMTFVLHAKLI